MTYVLAVLETLLGTHDTWYYKIRDHIRLNREYYNIELMIDNGHNHFSIDLRVCLIYFWQGGILQPMEFPGQGSDLSCSCNLHLSCGNARSFNSLCQARG